jgi:SAM-dependent methyltransferase
MRSLRQRPLGAPRGTGGIRTASLRAVRLRPRGTAPLVRCRVPLRRGLQLRSRVRRFSPDPGSPGSRARLRGSATILASAPCRGSWRPGSPSRHRVRSGRAPRRGGGAGLGWSRTGDFNVAEAEARAHGHPVVVGELSEDRFADWFDAATMIEVIEHIPDPRPTLTAAHGLIREGGALLVTTGDLGSARARLQGVRWHYIRPPLHVSYYTRETMKRLLLTCGFSRVAFAPTFNLAFPSLRASSRLRDPPGNRESFCQVIRAAQRRRGRSGRDFHIKPLGAAGVFARRPRRRLRAPRPPHVGPEAPREHGKRRPRGPRRLPSSA